MRIKKPQIWGLKIFTIAFAIAIFVDLSCTYIFYKSVVSYTENLNDIGNADAGIIFYGDSDRDNKSIGPDSRNRAEVAIDLYHKNKIQNIIAIGGYNYKNRKTEQHFMKTFLIEQQIPQSIIYHDSISYNTITNWKEAKKIMQMQNFEKVIAISSPLHIYRIEKMIKDENVGYATYRYNLKGFDDYYRLYRAIHHEWKSYLLSFLFKEKLRNKISYTVRTTMGDIKDFFRDN